MSPSLPPTRSEKLAFAKPIVSVASFEKYVRHIPHVPTDIILSVKAISRGLVRLPPLIVTISPLSYPTLYNESLGMSSTRLPHIFTSSTAALTSIAFSPTGSLSESEHENSIAVSNAKNNIFFISVTILSAKVIIISRTAKQFGIYLSSWMSPQAIIQEIMKFN